jgi:hypothetical protein
MTSRASTPVGRLPSGWRFDAVASGGRWVAVVYSPRGDPAGLAGAYPSMLEALSAAHRAALVASLDAWFAASYAAWARDNRALFEAPRK